MSKVRPNHYNDFNDYAGTFWASENQPGSAQACSAGDVFNISFFYFQIVYEMSLNY